MPPDPKSLDPKRLARDAKRAQAQRPDAGIGRETTGVTRAVRAGLPVIRELRAAGVTWAAIAEAMGAQGVTQGAGAPLLVTKPGHEPFAERRQGNWLSDRISPGWTVV
jgi:hypothetical protein